MAAFQPSVSALASRGGTDLAKPSRPRGNIHAETQEAMWQAALRPSNELARKNRAQRPRGASLIEAAAARSNKNEKKRGAEPDSAIPSEVVDKNVQVREARGTHMRRYSVQEVD